MSAESGNFIDAEKAQSTDDSGAVLWRFLREVPQIGMLILPSMVFGLVAASGLQAFSWLSGILTQCVDGVPCVAVLPEAYIAPFRFLFPERFANELPLSLRFLILYAIAIVVIRLIGWVIFEIGGQVACVGLFARMMRHLTHTKTTFFDEQPSGRILNRAVRDFEQLRYLGPIRIGDALNSIVELVVMAVLIGFAHPLAGFVVVPTLIVFLYIQRNIAPMLQFCIVRRSIAFGEVLHRETDAIEGIRTFVLYGQHRSLFERLRRGMTSFTEIHLVRAQIEAWGRFCANVSSAVCSFVALVAVGYGIEAEVISTTFAAVVMTAIFRLAGTFNWLTWTLGYLFETAGHARRIFEYIDLPNEVATERSDRGAAVVPQVASKTTAAGTSDGLQFCSYTMSYRVDTPIILNQLTVEIPVGAHVGIIGRTGAGKSTLVQSLFRMVYVHSGDIKYRGESIYNLPIEKARGLSAVMPQDPYLFAGTVRDNLDPMHQHSDSELQGLLSEAQLSFGLDYQVSEGGLNFSLGQRQLMGLVRVLLSKSPIVIMDEPTSSVDSITDALIQKMLREKLRGRTVLTIAHRLGTLRTSDSVLELEAGRVKRFGPPREILKAIESELSELVQE